VNSCLVAYVAWHGAVLIGFSLKDVNPYFAASLLSVSRPNLRASRTRLTRYIGQFNYIRLELLMARPDYIFSLFSFPAFFQLIQVVPARPQFGLSLQA
jgi:hypothetical protein